MAGGEGFEPSLAESESAVLPLDDPPSGMRQFRIECRQVNAPRHLLSEGEGATDPAPMRILPDLTFFMFCKRLPFTVPLSGFATMLFHCFGFSEPVFEEFAAISVQ